MLAGDSHGVPQPSGRTDEITVRRDEHGVARRHLLVGRQMDGVEAAKLMNDGQSRGSLGERRAQLYVVDVI
jgi:hypothetical protein